MIQGPCAPERQELPLQFDTFLLTSNVVEPLTEPAEPTFLELLSRGYM